MRLVALLLLALAAAPQDAAATTLPSQGRDWLVHPTSTPAAVTSVHATAPYPSSATAQLVSISNGLVERQFYVDNATGAWCTVEYRHLVSGMTFLRALAPEANLTLSGMPLNVGGCLGQPADHPEFWTPETWASKLTADPAAMRFKNFTTDAPAPPFPWTPGTRHSPTDISWPPKGVHMTAYFTVPPSTNRVSRARSSSRGNTRGSGGGSTTLAGLVVGVHYELYEGLPALRKWVSVHHEGDPAAGAANVTVDTLNYELLRAPNFAPSHMSCVLQQANNPVPFDEQVVPVTGQSFPGRDYQMWFWDPHYDAPGDREIHVTYTYYTFLVVGYTPSVTYGGPTGPGAVVSPGGPAFESLSVRQVLHDSAEQERKGLGVRRMHRALAPQMLENPVPFMITDVSSSAAMRLAVDQASETGHELVIIGYGAAGWCGMCFAQLNNASFVSWIKSEVEYANAKGVGVSGYSLQQHNGWGEVVPTAEQTLSRAGARGPTACFSTDWHAAYREATLAFLKETGFSGMETDGQYESIPCADTGGDHHHNGIAGGWSSGIQVTLDFNAKLKGLVLYQTGADGYCFSGANKWNHADTDAFGHLPLWEQQTVGRMYIYDSVMNRLPSSGQIGVNDLASSSKGCSRPRVQCFDFILGSQYLMGSIPSFRANVLYDPSDADAAALNASITKWTSFYKSFRGPRPSGAAGLLIADLIHIARPDSRHLEAVVHVTADASAPSRALLALVNPPEQTIQENVTVPLYYAGIVPGTTVTVQVLNISSSGAAVHGTSAAGATTSAVVGADARAGYTDIVVSAVVPASGYMAVLVSTASATATAICGDSGRVAAGS